MNDTCCEKPGCSMPCTTCPACEQCLCWQHRQDSSCEVCHKLLVHASFEHRLGRLLSFGLSILLCGIFFLFLPRDDGGLILQAAVALLVVGFLMIWIGLLARV